MDVNTRATSRGWVKPSGGARYAGVSSKVFRGWLASGLRHSRLPSGRILVSFCAIDEFLQQFEVVEGKPNDPNLERLVENLTEGLT